MTVRGSVRDICWVCFQVHERGMNPEAPACVLKARYFKRCAHMVRYCRGERIPGDLVDIENMNPRRAAIAKKIFSDLKIRTTTHGNGRQIEIMRKFGEKGVRQILDDCLVKGDDYDFRQNDVPEFMAMHLGEAMQAVLASARRLGEARMAVMTKSMEFCRSVYGTNGTPMQVCVMYVCQACGHMPKYDYDYFVTDKCGQNSGWYCAKCGEKYDKQMMNGALVVRFAGRPKNSFAVRIRMPSGRAANFLSFFKYVNCYRAKVINISRAAKSTVQNLVQELKTMIMKDNEMAVAALTAMGATTCVGEVQMPKLPWDYCPAGFIVEGDCEITLKKKDVGSLITFVDVHGVITQYCDLAIRPGVVQKILEVLFCVFGEAEMQAMELSVVQENKDISNRDMKRIRDWYSVRSTGKYSDGSLAPPRDIEMYSEMPIPVAI